MATDKHITAKWHIDVSSEKPNAVSAAAFARLIHPQIYAARKEIEEALSSENKLAPVPQLSPDAEKDMLRMRELEAELASLQSKYQ